MELGISTASFYPQMNTEDSIDKIIEVGCYITEVFLQTDSEYSLSFGYELLNKLQDKNLEVYSVHGSSSQFEPQLFSSYKREVDDTIKIFKKIFRICKLLGAKYYVFHGPRLSSFDKESWNFVIDRMGLIADIGKDYGIGIAQENVSWCLSGNKEFLKYINLCKLDNIYFTFDNKQAIKSQNQPMEILEIMGEKLVNVHISDIDGNDIGFFPKQGNFDFSNLFNRLVSLSYKGPVFIEVYGKYLPLNLSEQFTKFKGMYL